MPQKPNNNNQDHSSSQAQHKSSPSYEYFTDSQGRIKRFRKLDPTTQYTTRPGYIRFRFLEKYYIWWKRKSFDFKLMIMPWFVGFFAVFVIYQFSMIWSQNDLQREVKSKLVFEFNKETLQKMKKLKSESSSDDKSLTK